MMKITKQIVSCFSFFLLLVSTAFAANSPVGYWKTIDDVTGQPKSILHITESGGALYGQIVKIWPSPGKTENEVCTECKGSRHNKRIVGMVIMEGLRQNADNPNKWTGGEILDPKNGKTYHCNIEVVDNGQRLNVRGYIGVPMFGRSQTWLRVSGASG